MSRRRKASAGGRRAARRGATKAPGRARRGFLGRLARRLFRVALSLALIVVLLVWVCRFVDPPGGIYMASEHLRLGGVERRWRDIDRISPHMARAAMAAEDARFCDHGGFDLEAIGAALTANLGGEGLRGGSTISQQVAKNVFLWHRRSWVRKGLETGFTVLIEALWSKRRILEVYLNVAEFGPGVFGVEAASRRVFRVSASDLSLTQASRLAAVLPAPKKRSARDPSARIRARARAIAEGAATLKAAGRDTCVFSGDGGASTR